MKRTSMLMNNQCSSREKLEWLPVELFMEMAPVMVFFSERTSHVLPPRGHNRNFIVHK